MGNFFRRRETGDKYVILQGESHDKKLYQTHWFDRETIVDKFIAIRHFIRQVGCEYTQLELISNSRAFRRMFEVSRARFPTHVTFTWRK